MQAGTRKGIPLKWLLTVSFLNSFGFDFIWPLASVYMHDDLYQTMVTVGWVLFGNAFAQMIGALLAGRLFDTHSPKRLLRAGLILMMAFFVALIFVHSWPVFPFLLTGTGFVYGWLSALINSMGTRVYSHDGRFVFNMLYFIANFGMAIGTAIVGFVFAQGAQWLFICGLILYAITLTVAWRYLNVDITPSHSVGQHTDNQKHKFKMPQWNLTIIYTLVVALVILHTAYVQWQGNLSVYMSSILQLPIWQYSILWTINGALIGVFQLLLNVLNLTSSRKAMIWQILLGLAFFGMAFLILPFAKNFAVFAIAMVITTLGETIAFPMVPVLVNEITPMSTKGRYQGLLSAAPSMGRAIGPLAGGAIIDTVGYRFLFNSAAGMTFVAIIGVGLVIAAGFRKTIKY